MELKTAEFNFKLIDQHPHGNFYVDNKGKIIEISKWNLIGRLIKHCLNLNGDIRKKVNNAITETLLTVNKSQDQKQAVLSKLSKSREISLQISDQKIQNTASINLLGNPVLPILTSKPPIITLPVTGFANGGNTCYLASALQILRSIPVVREHLYRKESLEKRMPSESDVTLSLRQKAKDLLAQLIHLIDQDKPVSSASMKDLEEVYAKINPDVKIGKGNDVSDVFTYVINLILDIESEANRPLSVRMYGELSEEEALKRTENQLNRCLSQHEEIPKILPFTRPNPNTNQCNTPCFSLQDVITITAANGKTYSYQLVGARPL